MAGGRCGAAAAADGRWAGGGDQDGQLEGAQAPQPRQQLHGVITKENVIITELLRLARWLYQVC